MLLEHAEGFGGAPIDLSTPSPKALAWLLRHREKWPRGFKFDFIDCNKCAMGLMHRFWFMDGLPTVELSAKALGISVHQAIEIFVARQFRGSWPEAIAMDLERLDDWRTNNHEKENAGHAIL